MIFKHESCFYDLFYTSYLMFSSSVVTVNDLCFLFLLLPQVSFTAGKWSDCGAYSSPLLQGEVQPAT